MTAEQLISSLRDEKEAEAKRHHDTVTRALAVLPVALETLRDAADHGNVRCIAGLEKISEILKQHGK